VVGRATGKLGLTRLTTARTWGKPPPSPLYYIVCVYLRLTSKWLFVSKLPSGSPEIAKIGTLTTLGPITLCVDLRLKWGLKQSCSPRWELSNNMSHATCTQGNRGDSWLLVIRSQIANLIIGLFFGHNLCFSCLNGSCKPILDIYVSIAFEWYEKFFEPLGFDPCNHFLNIQESTRTLTPNMGIHLGVWGFFPSHSFALLGAWECNSWA
jgi:hypothetical protein